MWPGSCEDISFPLFCITRILSDEVGTRSSSELVWIKREVEKWLESLSYGLSDTCDFQCDLSTREEECDSISDIDPEPLTEVIIHRDLSLPYHIFSSEDSILERSGRDIELSGELSTHSIGREVCFEGLIIYLCHSSSEDIIEECSRSYHCTDFFFIRWEDIDRIDIRGIATVYDELLAKCEGETREYEEKYRHRNE
jgi:hypothetical protein